MSNDSSTPKPFSLKRWSERKLAAARASPDAAEGDRAAAPLDRTAASASSTPLAPPSSASDAVAAPAVPLANEPAGPTNASAAPAATGVAPSGGRAAAGIESLTIDSDYSAFLRPDVDESLKRAALKQLFRDPRFNVMDGLDVYIDDYTKPDPVPPDLVKQMVQGRYIFDPPKTRVTEAGNVEDIVPEPPTITDDRAAPEAAAPDAALPDADAASATALLPVGPTAPAAGEESPPTVAAPAAADVKKPPSRAASDEPSP